MEQSWGKHEWVESRTKTPVVRLGYSVSVMAFWNLKVSLGLSLQPRGPEASVYQQQRRPESHH